MKQRFSRIEDAIEALAAGRVIIVLDSEDRENEGDLIAAAQTATPHTVHFMVSEGRGQLCMPVLPDVTERLDLPLMVPGNTDASMPRFTIPIDHRKCHTGISPLERTFSIHAIIDPDSRPADFVRPGHIFPLIARPNGVLERPGHTEATIDLARLAGLTPAGILCEVCSRNGLNMATCDELMNLSAEFDLPIITIDALIEYRQQAESRTSRSLDRQSGQRDLTVRTTD